MKKEVEGITFSKDYSNISLLKNNNNRMLNTILFVKSGGLLLPHITNIEYANKLETIYKNLETKLNKNNINIDDESNKKMKELIDNIKKNILTY